MTVAAPEIKKHEVGDAELTYLEYNGEGPTVVLLHATGFLPWLWHSIALELARHHRVIVPALYDHRPSDPYKGGLPWMQLAKDLKRLCVDLSIEQSVLVGHSMGATVATLAHAVLKLPSDSLVLIEPIFLPSGLYGENVSVDQHPLAAKAVKRRNQWRDRAQAGIDLKSKPFFQTWDAKVLDLYIEHGLCDEENGGVRLACPPLQEAALFIGGSYYDPWPVLPAVACPALVVEGEKSENRPWINLQRVVELIPQGHYAMVPGVGHLVPMEKPLETARLIQAFLKGFSGR